VWSKPIGPEVANFKKADEVYGVTNEQFCGAYAECALASAKMMARKPRRLGHVEAASVPVVAVTAWQMLFDYARVVAGQSVLILGAAGNVGAYAVQLAASAGLDVVAVVRTKDLEYVRSLGAQGAVAFQAGGFAEAVHPVDVVIDTVGGDAREHSYRVLKPGGILVSVVSTDPMPAHSGVRSVFFYVEVTTARLNTISELLDRGKLPTQVGTVLLLEDVRTAHEMLGGAPHARGKIVLTITS
jgi:NADPH:quinone reductase-like Zn-dependent oxidoreductase